MVKLPELEEKWLKYWQDHRIFEKSLAKPSAAGNFVFFEGPPTANGQPGLHHVLARAFKDLIPRYKTMRGFRVERKAGWDTQGLPVEIQVEKKLGLRASRILKNTALKSLTIIAAKTSGSTKRIGKNLPSAWVFGWTWNIPTLPTRTIIWKACGGF